MNNLCMEEDLNTRTARTGTDSSLPSISADLTRPIDHCCPQPVENQRTPSTNMWKNRVSHKSDVGTHQRKAVDTTLTTNMWKPHKSDVGIYRRRSVDVILRAT